MQIVPVLQISRADHRHLLRALGTALLAALLLALALHGDARADGGGLPDVQEVNVPEQLEAPQAIEGVEKAGGQVAEGLGGTGTEVAEGVGGTGAEVGEGVGDAAGELVPETPVPVETPVEPQPVVPPGPQSPEGEEAHAPTPLGTGEEAPVATTPTEGSEAVAGTGSGEAPSQGKGAGSAEEAAGGAPAHSTLLAASVADGPGHPGLSSVEVVPPMAAPATVNVAEVSDQAPGKRSVRPGGAGGGGPSGFGCELSGLGASNADNCTAGLLAAPSEPAAAATGAVVAAVSSLVVDSSANAPPGGHGGAALGGQPLTPAPAPAPGGASGTATGGGASAGGVSIFLTLAGLLLLGAPRAMRRLGLSFEPWLAGCFVLIPEHPD
jgi:hypothetical protein